MLQNHYQISLNRLLAIIVMVLIYAYMLISWQVIYWIDQSVLLNYFALANAAEMTTKADTSLWFSPGVWFDAITYLLPLLLFFRGLGVRLIFYILFFAIYFFPVEPYQSVVVTGFIDSNVYTIVAGAVGVLLGADIYRINRDRNRISSKINSKKFQTIVFAFAVVLVLISSLVHKDEAALVLDAATIVDGYIVDSARLGMPFLQTAVFILLAAGVFINSKAQAAFILLSWIVLVLSWGFRLEWSGYLLVADIYALLSGILLWNRVAPEQRDHRVLKGC